MDYAENVKQIDPNSIKLVEEFNKDIKSDKGTFQSKIANEHFYNKSVQEFSNLESNGANEDSKMPVLPIVDKKCGVCKMIFCYQLKFDEHVQEFHCNETAYKCRYCSERFFNISLLSNHVKIIHKSKTVINEKPQRRVASYNASIHACNICRKTFKNYALLKYHLKTCDISFNKPENFRTVINENSQRRVTSNAFTHSCNICRKSFKNVALLKYHQKICDLTSNEPKNLFCKDQMCIKNESCLDYESAKELEAKYTLEICKTEYKLEETILEAVLKPICSQQKQEEENESKNIPNFRDIKEEFPVDSECANKMEIEKELPINVINNVANTTSVNQYFDESSKNIKDSLQSHKVGKNTTKRQSAKFYVCEFCSLSFKRKSWRDHLRTHTGERPYSCSFCKKSFSNGGSLHNHLGIHSGERAFTCSLCNKSFTRKSCLMRHKKTHTSQKEYLTKHQRVHTGERPYSCSFCTKHLKVEVI